MNALRDNSDTAVASQLDQVVVAYGLADVEMGLPVPGPLRRRRGFAGLDTSGLASLSLVRDEGALRWLYLPPAMVGRSLRSRRASARPLGSDVLHSFTFKELKPNQAIQALEDLDRRLTPNQGLRLLKNGVFVAVTRPKINGPVLLLIHGTFSKSDMFLDELQATAAGKDFLARAGTKYKAILAFDHPTLSVSPWINALDLEFALPEVTGPIDVICHSRGGLVASWWLRNAKRDVGKAVFVGSPLHGTSLASPANLRASLDVLANVFRSLQLAGAAASTVLPLMATVAGLSKIFGGVLRLGASTPIVDAGIALVPGLAAQSRVSNNAELKRLHQEAWASTSPEWHAVVSNFKPLTSDGRWWEIWKHLRSVAVRVGDAAIDAIIDGKNDLVVDNDSMAILFKKPFTSVCDFGDSPTVHHCNYFSQPETATFLIKKLKV